jgi:hypothetical protein
MASVVHPHFRDRLEQFRIKAARSSATIVDLDQRQPGAPTRP